MKRGHRRWHRLIGWVLLPTLALTLLSTWWARSPPLAPAELPPAWVNSPVEKH
jgi:hypothetical protein